MSHVPASGVTAILQHLVSFFVPALAAVALTPVVIRVARALGLVDVPNARAVHRCPTPRVGGVAIVVAAAVGLLAASVVDRGRWLAGAPPHFWRTLAACGAMFLVGLVDDLVSLPSKVKCVAIAAAAAAVCSGGAAIETLAFHNGPVFHLGVLAWPFTILLITTATVSLNFIDGLDGLAAGISAIALGVVFLLAGHDSLPAVALLSLCVLGAVAGFLGFNLNPARIFMGDGGSMFLGFLLGATGAHCVAASGSVAAMAAVGMVLGVPLLDLPLTMIRRGVLQRRSLFAAERGHVHHQLLDLGMPQRQVVGLLHLITLVLGGLGVLAFVTRDQHTLLALGAALAVLLAVFRRAGAVRFRELLRAVRRNREIGRQLHDYKHSFEEMQLRFRNVTDFDGWWLEVRTAADRLQLARLSIDVNNRDGSGRVLEWRRSDDRPGLDGSEGDVLGATIPVRHRRLGGSLNARVQVSGGSLEAAGRRVALFARLMEEHHLGTLPEARIEPRPPRPDDRDSAAWLGKPLLPAVGPVLSLQGPVTRKGNAMACANLKVAVIHDFLYTYAGAERVLEQILHVVPQADVFSLFDFLPDKDRGFLQGKKVTSSFLQGLPMARTKHRSYLPLMPLAVEQLDVSAYDVVISSSYIAAKGVITRPGQLHVCYCHSPVRFAWDLQHQYLAEAGLTSGLKSMMARAILHYIRNWDTRTANGVDVFVANSDFIGRRIEKVYRRKSVTIYPPVDTDSYRPHYPKDDFYLTVSRMVPYKRVDLIVEAFGRMPNKRLVVIGDGPDFAAIKARAGANVRMLGHQPAEVLREYMQRARGFVFAAEEDFGIVPVEAMACGTPVIGFGRGGVTESVVSGQTGVFFDEQTPESLLDAIRRFEATPDWDPHVIRERSERFSVMRFRQQFGELLTLEWERFLERQGQPRPADAPRSPLELTIGKDLDMPPKSYRAGGNGSGSGAGNGKHATPV